MKITSQRGRLEATDVLRTTLNTAFRVLSENDRP